MESNLQRRFTLGQPSAGASEKDAAPSDSDEVKGIDEAMDSGIRLMYLASEGDLEGMEELIDSGAAVNFCDVDGRTALHVAACQGRTDAIDLLLRRGAEVDVKDRWQSTPLADAICYKKNDVIKLLEAHGAKPPMAPMHVRNGLEVPEYEINPRELDFTGSVELTKGTFCIASWRGIQVAVKKLGEEFFIDEEKVKAFRDELTLLQKMRHPNVVQFLGAVTQSTPMMIVTEYLPKGDIGAYLKRKRSLRMRTVIKFALDIARGMNYLHEHKPERIIHGDLEPSNILMDDSGHLKVADFGLSKLLQVTKTTKGEKLATQQQISWRYAAPEVVRNMEYDTKVDVFSFALILQEMIEGHPPFPTKTEVEVAKAYVANERPPFLAPVKRYSYGLRQLIQYCWNDEPAKRPSFLAIIPQLNNINQHLAQKMHWKVKALRFLQRFESILKLDQSVGKSDSCPSSVR